MGVRRNADGSTPATFRVFIFMREKLLTAEQLFNYFKKETFFDISTCKASALVCCDLLIKNATNKIAKKHFINERIKLASL